MIGLLYHHNIKFVAGYLQSPTYADWMLQQQSFQTKFVVAGYVYKTNYRM